MASKFKKSSVDQDGEPSLHSYRKTSDEFKQSGTTTTTEPGLRRRNLKGGAYAGDYDSELVDGKYVTSVPIVNQDQDSGNLRPSHREPPKGLRDLKAVSNPRDDLIQRLSRTTSNSQDRKTVSQGNVFDRLANPDSGSRTNLSSRKTLANGTSSTSSRPATASTRANTTALSKIRDLTKTMRKDSNEELNVNDKSSNNVVAPRNSLTLFSDRKENSTNLANSKSSINSSTRSLQKDSPKTARRATTSAFGKINNLLKFVQILRFDRTTCTSLESSCQELQKILIMFCLFLTLKRRNVEVFDARRSFPPRRICFRFAFVLFCDRVARSNNIC